MAVKPEIVPGQKSTSREFRARLALENAASGRIGSDDLRLRTRIARVLQPSATPVSRLQSESYLSAFRTALMNAEPFGVPRPVTLSQPGPVVREESVPKVNTSQRVDVEL